MSDQPSALSTQPTPGEWKSEIIGTSSGRWIRIYVDDDRFEDGRELFESATVQISSGRAKKRWKDTEEAAEIRANVALVLATRDMVASLKAVKALLSAPSPFFITKHGAPITNGDQEVIDKVFIEIDAAISKAERRA